MPGKAGKSGPPGNLNSARHPWRTFWRRRALKAEHKWVIPVLEAYEDELVTDKGGAESITAGERRMAEIARTARGCSMLILAEAAKRGFIRDVDGTWDLSPGAKELARFLGLERQALDSLGLGKRTKVKTLEELLAEGEEDGDGGGGGGDLEPEPEAKSESTD